MMTESRCARTQFGGDIADGAKAVLSHTMSRQILQQNTKPKLKRKVFGLTQNG